jgi:hypothetical protein
MRTRLALACLLSLTCLVVPLLAPAQAGYAGSVVREARWCVVNSGFIAHVQWDCRYPTLAICAASTGWRSDMCLENPNWNLPGYYHRR